MTIRGPLAVIFLVVAALSFATNFLILGYSAARIGDFRGGAIERVVALGTRGFPKEIRTAIVSGALAERSALRSAFSELREARQRMFAAMRAEPFDAAALAAAFAEVREKTTALQSLGQALVGKAVADAPASARADIRAPRWVR